jgi:preprotein translocase subunit SecG
MKTFLRNNGLGIAFLVLFFAALGGQVIFGFKEHNKELLEQGATALAFSAYLSSGHFLQSTFENWESEFLQMALFVVFTIFLQQKGSSESKDFDKEEKVDKEPSADTKEAPWPVKEGGFILTIYKHSLTIVLLVLFLLSFIVHFYGSLKDENDELSLKGLPLETAQKYIGDSRFWFESFQNWQSEFLSVFAIIILSIYFRQFGSSQSKPVDAPNMETGE